MQKTRSERDTMGEVQVPYEAYYGAQTQRAVENFPISGQTIPVPLIRALGLVKWAAACANDELGMFRTGTKRPLDQNAIEAIKKAAWEVAEGKFDKQFPVDIYQTGSGTSSNMNANEVIANRANELAGFDRFGPQRPIHPNDHVNLGQSSNDVFPTAIHVAAATEIRNRLLPALNAAQQTLQNKAQLWQNVLKIGRTHLMDAVPLTLGQEVSGWARQLELACQRACEAIDCLLELPIGGTAVGTGINTHPEFAARVCALLGEKTGIAFREAANHFEANSQRDALVDCHGKLRAIAVSVFSVANNIRWLGSGPRCGFYELKIPPLQPGSSIMPGKVNPVLCESVMQVAARVLGNDAAVAFAGSSGGQFQLHVMMPVMAASLLESILLLTNAVRQFTEKLLKPLEANAEACAQAVEKSFALATALNPYIGYEKAAEIAKEAFATGKTVRQICIEKGILPREKLDEVLDPWRMVNPR